MLILCLSATCRFVADLSRGCSKKGAFKPYHRSFFVNSLYLIVEMRLVCSIHELVSLPFSYYLLGYNFQSISSETFLGHFLWSRVSAGSLCVNIHCIAIPDPFLRDHCYIRNRKSQSLYIRHNPKKSLLVWIMLKADFPTLRFIHEKLVWLPLFLLFIIATTKIISVVSDPKNCQS